MNEVAQNIKNKIESNSKPLREFDVRIYYGIKTGYNEAFIINKETKDALIKKCPKCVNIIRPILRGKHIKRFGENNLNEWIINIPCGWTNTHRNNIEPEKYFKEQYPSIYEYLISKAEIQSKGKGLFDRDDKGDYWWELRPCTYLEEFKKEKILYIDIMTDNEPAGYPFPCFSYATGEVYTLNTAYFMTGEPNTLKYLLGILNSKIGKFIVKNNVTPLQKRQYRMFQQFVELFPIPNISIEEQQEIVKLVDIIIDKKRAKAESKYEEEKLNLALNAICHLNSNESSFILSQE